MKTPVVLRADFAWLGADASAWLSNCCWVAGVLVALLLVWSLHVARRSSRSSRRSAEAALANLQQTSARLQMILDRIPECVAVFDRELRLREISRAGLTIFDLPSADFIVGRAAQDLVLPEDWPMVAGKLAEVAQGRRCAARFRGRGLTGIVRWLEAEAVPLQEPNGALSGILVLTRDVSREHEAEARRRRGEWVLRQAQRLGRIGSWELELATGRLEASAELRRLFEWQDLADPMMADLLKRVHPEDHARLDRALRDATVTGKGWEIEFRVCSSTGGERVLVAQAEVLRGAPGTPSHIIGTVQDVTELKRAEAAQMQFQEKLQHAQKMEAIGTLAGGIAHDFNNILAGILCYSALLKKDLVGLPQAAEKVLEVERASLRARDLVRQILGLSRQHKDERPSTEMEPVFRDAMKLLRAVVPRMVELRCDLHCEGAVVAMHPVQVHQILMNLVGNAVQAMDNRGLVEIRVDCLSGRPSAALPADDYLRIRVKDHGPGIAPELVPRIFEPFFTTKPVGQGTGLGLPMVKRIVESHRGVVTVSTESGRGCVFEICLPRVPARTVAAATTTVAPVSPERGRGQAILLVEDELPLLAAQHRLLEGLGYQVTAKTSSVDAWATFASSPRSFDLVITDHWMPDMTGLDLGRRIRGLSREVPILLTTGIVERLDAKALQAVGVREVMAKPVPIDCLGSAVARAIGAGAGV